MQKRNIILTIVIAIVILIVGGVFLLGGTEKKEKKEELAKFIKIEKKEEEPARIEEGDGAWRNLVAPLPKEVVRLREEEKRTCMENFELEKIDLSLPFWRIAPPDPNPLLWGLILKGVEKNSNKICSVLEGADEINPLFSVKDCEKEVNFSFLVDKIKESGNCEEFIKGCVLRADKIICESLCRSYLEKRIVFLSERICSSKEEIDIYKSEKCEFFDAASGVSKKCRAGICRVAQYMVAVAKGDKELCKNIPEREYKKLCEFYFDKDVLKKLEEEVARQYCENMIIYGK